VNNIKQKKTHNHPINREVNAKEMIRLQQNFITIIVPDQFVPSLRQLQDYPFPLAPLRLNYR